MDIIAITIGSYPYGVAKTNRHLSYLRGLAEKNISVELLSLAPDKNQSLKSNLKNTEYKGVKIKYLSPLLYPANKIGRILNLMAGIILGVFNLFRRVKAKQRKHILILLVTAPIILLLYICIGKLLRYKIVHERGEYPFVGHNKKLMLKFYLKFLIPKFNGLFVITHALKEYFANFTEKTIYVLPMSVEAERFNKQKELSNERYIAYCGSMYSDKDGVPDLIKSFNIIAKNFNSIKLVLIGDNKDDKKFKIIADAIDESPVKNRIICTGLMDRDYMPNLLINAEILALARPDNIQAKGGFPTKLGEYLSTGNPVVITDVGEHSKYLEDGISAYIVKPGDPIEFAKRISDLLTNPCKAKAIGSMGKKVAYKFFDYRSQSENLKKYFDLI